MEDRYYHITRDELQRLWESRMIAEDIAKHFGVSRTFIYEARKAMQLPERDPVRADAVPDPTPEEIAERARECRERRGSSASAGVEVKQVRWNGRAFDALA